MPQTAPGWSGVGSSLTPDVTVVIAVYNGMPELTRSVTSALNQSLPPERIEVIVVDDGSTDETPHELDRLAAQHLGRLQVVHQPPSGGPSRPRNIGLELARGRYAFFLDADDYLGTEALERLVSVGDRTKADVVLGKVVDVATGRSPSVFQRDDDAADLYSSKVIWTLNAQKLFRREMLSAEPAIRFPEDLWTGEDAVFTMRAYLRSGRIAVLGSYTCYYKVRREQGGHVTSRPGAEPRFRALAALIEVIAAGTEPGSHRDALLVRPFKVGIVNWFGPRYLTLTSSQRNEVLRLGRPLVERWLTPSVAARLTPLERLELHLVGQGRGDLLEELLSWLGAGDQVQIVVDNGRSYCAYPFFRDPRYSIPEEVFEVSSGEEYRHPVTSVRRTGRTVSIQGVASGATGPTDLELVLVERHRGEQHRVPVRRRALPGAAVGTGAREHGYVVDIDLARVSGGRLLGDGVWDLYLAVGGAVNRERVGHTPQAPVAVPSPWLVTGRAADGSKAGVRVTPYFTKQHGALTITVRDAPEAVVVEASGAKPERPKPRRSRTRRRRSRRTPSFLASALRRILARAGVQVLPAGKGTVLATRRRGLAVTPAPARSFLVTPQRSRPEVWAFGESGFVAFQGAAAQEVAPGQLVLTSDSTPDRKLVQLMPGTALVTSSATERDRWIEHGRALLGYTATQHILGVLRTYQINCVLDVGANRGQYATMLRKAGYRGHILSFEPVPSVAEGLARTAAGDDKWTVHPIALGREDGMTSMHVVPGQGTLSSMLPPSDFGKQRFPTMRETRAEEVPVRRLDGLLDSLLADIPGPRVFLKLDTQGFDLAVFEGLGERAGDIAALQSELALLNIYEGMPRMPEALQIYEAKGFEVSGLFPVSREFDTTRILEYDAILVRAAAVPARRTA